MRVALRTLEVKSLSELRSFYASIPAEETVLEIVGIFWNAAHAKIALALSELPRHVSAFKLSGQHTYYEHSRAVQYRHDDAVWVTYYTCEIGRFIPVLVSSLPSTVNSLSLAFSYNTTYAPGLVESHRMEGLIEAMRSLPAHIKVLDLFGVESSNSTESFARAISRIPPSVKQFRLNLPYWASSIPAVILEAIPSSLEFIDLSDNSHSIGMIPESASRELIRLFSALRRGLIRLVFKGNQFWQHATPELTRAFTGLPATLTDLDIGNNELRQKGREALHAMIENLPAQLIVLGLSQNGLSSLRPEDLAFALSALHAPIVEVDLGDNGLLLLLEAALTIILTSLPATVHRLRLCERTVPDLSGSQLAARIACTPRSIDTLSFSNSNLFSLAMAEFVVAMGGLNATNVTTLDLTGNALGRRSTADLVLLFSRIPARIKTIKLNQNSLSKIDTAAFREMFEVLPRTVEAVDLRENGFDCLLHTRLNELLSSLPDIAILIEVEKLGIRNDGALVLHSPPHAGFFKPERAIRHQKALATLLPVLGQIMTSKRLTPALMSHIISFAGDIVVSEENRRLLLRKIEMAPTIISAIPPLVITAEIERACILAVQARIRSLRANITRLDLNHCGLNRLDSTEKLQAVFELIPITLNALSLRGNGFSHSEASKRRLINALRNLHRGIKYLDLSNNGFETYDSANLARLFAHLPATVELVSLSHERPVHPADHIAKRVWPLSYSTLFSRNPEPLIQMRNILDDYTKGDSAAWRVFYGHWNRHHVKEVAKIVRAIDAGRIINIKDVLCELELIELLNPRGSLARRVAFLFKSSFDHERAPIVPTAVASAAGAGASAGAGAGVPAARERVAETVPLILG